jgi:hypothetical protein
MKLPNPINSTNKTTKSANHLFYSTMVSGCLAFMVGTTLAPHIQTMPPTTSIQGQPQPIKPPKTPIPATTGSIKRPAVGR